MLWPRGLLAVANGRVAGNAGDERGVEVTPTVPD